MKSTRILLIPFLSLAQLVLSSAVLAQTTWTVDRLTDIGEGSGLTGDLRYCITNVENGDRIAFAVEGTINLTSTLPTLTRSISIEGPGANLLAVLANCGIVDISTVFTVFNATVYISGLTVSNACQHGIYNIGTLTVSSSTVSGNGGGIWNDFGRSMVIVNSTVSGNGDRGGIDNRGALTISNSTISDNTSYDFASGGGYGAGIANVGALTISDSTIAGNYAIGDPSEGGGIGNGFFATLNVRNSTISGNSALRLGGGIANRGTLAINNSTISNNDAEHGGGLFNASTMSARNTIIASNTSASGTPDLAGNLGSLGYNLIGDSRGGSGYHEADLLDLDPLLGSLRDNGGPTLTHALLEGSPALDRGNNADAPAWDQRGEGFLRIVNDIIDIGAFEVQTAMRRADHRETFNCSRKERCLLAR